ncbi:MarR family winged helix-turn-helix transcriptional regulator [Fusibacter ferrireducens]|uniref:Winged helix-turn-helix transcriptional regulator n=1 Tax=Fusibacter ferrireducens TaxID=2785058 RepID=A0ABR9ZMB8_9FIRM|nr:MarR family winged helix-turn-helix transcriptional regulator [Fusibacter ferrireducens]MBF4691613.1 winged helix-turn-helix transcriptional regulator [Fusibacter ferrireducens]
MDKKCISDGHSCNLESCLFFSSTKLARAFKKIADEAFNKTGLSPSHAFLLNLVNSRGEIHQKEVGELLHLTPSTITRFVEKLERMHLISRKSEGKNIFISKTEKGMALQPDIVKAWDDLHARYRNILTETETETFIKLTNKLLGQLGDGDIALK